MFSYQPQSQRQSWYQERDGVPLPGARDRAIRIWKLANQMPTPAAASALRYRERSGRGIFRADLRRHGAQAAGAAILVAASSSGRAGLVVLGVLIDVPDVIEAPACQDVLGREHGGHHRVVLIIVF